MYILTDYYRLRLTKGRPNLSSEKALHRDKTAVLGTKKKKSSGHKSQSGLDTKTY
jgi:hypothetical protein